MFPSILRLPHCLLALALVLSARAFAPCQEATSSRRSSTTTVVDMMVPQAPPPVAPVDISSMTAYVMDMSREVSPSSPLLFGVDSYVNRGATSSIQVALQERKIPTKEEIQAKQNTFNIIFWGTLSTLMKETS